MQAEMQTILDPESGAQAQILVSLGFNCFSWRPVLDDGPREMLWAHPAFSGGGERPSGSGIPLLFPFPGRVGGAQFTFDGRRYELAPGDSGGNAIHGFVFDRPWRVVEQREDRIVGEFHASIDDGSVLAHWPSDFRIRVSYRVTDRELLSEIHYENTGDGPLPCGFGTHAYFRLPLVEGGDREATCVHVPAAKVWEAKDMLPTGRLAAATGELNLADGGPLAGRKFDTYFTALDANSDGRVVTRLIDSSTQRTVEQSFDPTFTQCVVYTPPHREAICLEPYTCVPNPFHLAAEGYATGLQTLQPGESVQTEIRIGARR